ncbi:MAG: preprotein translocase subunit YajC [Prevotella sp.]|nr:preprotein translocase subunit YajC [Prevotella sp.]
MNSYLLLQAAPGQGSGTGFLIMMVAVFAIMWFFMIRPQQKKQKEIRKFQNALSEGSKVITGGGIFGTVKRIDINTGKVEVEIARGVVIEVDKSYVFADVSALQSQNNQAAK